MHVEMSTEPEVTEPETVGQDKPAEIGISGSQVATPVMRQNGYGREKNFAGSHTLAISTSAVTFIVTLYLMIVLVM